MGTRLMYYDKEGKKITSEEWSILLNDDDYKRLFYTSTPAGDVSTVWVGLGYGEEPEIFETAVMPVDGSWDVVITFSSIEDAENAHREAINKLWPIAVNGDIGWINVDGVAKSS